ncbi:hypothetical protein A1O1_07036 [Capronia coronata CBS 617.96]|uniref:chitinase n=1 Tax=Capronia coronata CBS 617.96 TaxID=1182541 RepID=W9XT84_9EURO|nr:uncharacterized protein A1O1_07036 [Capronia coronata CBS 617.96]EXJ83413.1 hypothetical protein A1O1_07036 [Capronia coronata CBS 617.96]
MAALRRLLFGFLVAALCIASGFAQDKKWEDIATSMQDLLDAIRASHEDYLADSGSKLGRRDAGVKFGRSSYWRPLAPSQRPSSAEDFSDQLSQLVSSLGSSLEELIQLLASHFDIDASHLRPETSRSAILPITLWTTQAPSTASSASHGAVTTKTGGTTSQTRAVSSSTASSPMATSTFNPQASDLNVVYYSQTDLTPVISLDRICEDDSVDMVIIAFVTALFSGGGYPAMNMASNCWAPNAAQQAAGATKLLDCVGDGFANKVARCQNKGKKVLLSLGGYYGYLSMADESRAVEAAHMLWNLFLGGSDPNSQPLRPYGNVVLDGIDIDNETPSDSSLLPILASTLRQLFASDSSKPYYLSAAPQCPRPDASIPVPQLLNYIDFFSVQFYNNPSCQLSSTDQGFFTSLQAWSDDLLALDGATVTPTGSGTHPPGSRDLTDVREHSMRIRPKRQPLTGPSSSFVNTHNGITAPRLLIGTPAFPGAGSGFVDVATYKGILQRVKTLALPNLAGAIFWDGAYQEVTGQVIDGSGLNTTFAQVVKNVLG